MMNEKIFFALGESSLGTVLIAKSAAGICAISMDEAAETLLSQLHALFPNATQIDPDADFARLLAWIEKPNSKFDVPLDIRGTTFQQRVWQELRGIPCGETATYTQIAHRIGAPKAVRAVASACAANKLAVVIPCHRVVRSDGALSGYRWGIKRKRALLDKEKLLTSKF